MLIEEIEFYNADGKKTTTVVPEKKHLKKKALDDRRSLYVGNLPNKCCKQDLRDLFEPDFGKITTIMLKKKQLKKPPKTFAFVEFEEGVDLKKVKQQMHDKVFMDKIIVIENILTREEKRSEDNNNHINTKPESDTKSNSGFKALSTHTLYVKNIPMKSSNEELAEIFGVAPRNINFVKRQLVDLRTNKAFFSDEFHIGEAFIKFDNLRAEDDIQKKCQEFQGQKASNGRVLLVKVASAKKNEQDQKVKDIEKIKQK